jgi:hypothetical protein
MSINQELKDYYHSLPEYQKSIFNQELQRYLLVEMGRLGSDYEAIKNNIPQN